MATYTLSLSPHQFFDDSGNPLASGRVYTYASGTSTPLSTYMTSSGTAWGAYVQLDSAGRPQNGEIYLQPGLSYKFIIQTSAGVTVDTVDPIGAVPGSASALDFTVTLGANVDAGDLLYCSDGTAITAGTWGLADADLTYASTLPELAFAVTAGSSGGQIEVRQGGIIDLAGPLTPGTKYYASATAGDITATVPINARYVGQAISVTQLVISHEIADSVTDGVVIDPRIKSICDGRLTLTTGVPVTTSDVTAATTVYWALYGGNQIGLYNGTRWQAFTMAQVSIAVPATTSQMYDVFMDYNAGTPALSLTAWTNDTTRATALTTQDGINVKTGALTSRYLGSFRTTGVSGQTEDSLAKRYVYNAYHRVDRTMRVMGSGTWNYVSGTLRQAGANTANQLDVVVGLAEDGIVCHVQSNYLNTNISEPSRVTIGVDSTSTPATGASIGYQLSAIASNNFSLTAVYEGYLAVGRHTLVWLEATSAAGTTTVTGASGTDIQSGIWATFSM